MFRKLKSAITLHGSRSLLEFLVLLTIIYLLLKSLKKVTIQSRIIGVLLQNGIDPITAQFVFSQAAHETGNFTSPLFFSNNNCFGMKPPTTYVVAIGEKFGYADYNSIEDSAKSMSMWLKSHGLASGLQTVDQYVNSLANQNYFEAPVSEYLAGVKHFYNMYYGQ
jgi:uncharacterized FlgJ-related protein